MPRWVVGQFQKSRFSGDGLNGEQDSKRSDRNYSPERLGTLKVLNTFPRTIVAKSLFPARWQVTLDRFSN